MLETPALYSARPTLAIAGTELPELGESLLSAVVAETTEGLYRCEAVFGNWGSADGGIGFVYSDRQVFDFGERLSVDMGGGDKAGTVFTGTITGLEARFPQSSPPEIAVLAEDRFQDLRMTRRTRTFEDVSDADIIREVGSAHGLTARVDVSGPTHRIVAQLNQSDLAFMRDRARAVDAELWVEGDTLHVKARAQRDDGEVTLTMGANLREASVLADVARQRTSITVAGWDVSAKEAIEYEATSSAVQPEVGSHASGISILEDAFGERPETVVHTVPLTAAEAQARAEALLRTTARGFVTVRGLTEGDARMRVGTHVELSGLGPNFGGRYYLTEVQHTFDGAMGYLTRFRGERPGLDGSSS